MTPAVSSGVVDVRKRERGVMVFWFVLRSPSIFRFVEPVVERLRSEGHRVEVSFDLVDADDQPSHADIATQLDVEVSALALGDPSRRSSRRVLALRALASYATFYRRWPRVLRARWLDYFPAAIRRPLELMQRTGLHGVVDAPLTARLLRRIARHIPIPSAINAQMARVAPSVVVVSPAIFPDSREIDAMRAAQAAGIPSAALALSWDNLTTKGLFHAPPDRLYVWNDVQVREASQWHDIDPEIVDVVGAPAFDYLFEHGRELERGAFLETLGLARDGRYILYGVSSRLGLGVGGEVEIVRRLATAIRAHDWPGTTPVLLVRRHPGNEVGWANLDVPGVHVWADRGYPASDERRTVLYNGLVHADAIVGLNTSLFVDAAVVDRPAVALLLQGDRLAERTPSRLVHFESHVAAGFLETVDLPEDAVPVLARLAAGVDARSAERHAFVERFVRPCGLQRPAAHVLAERLASLG